MGMPDEPQLQKLPPLEFERRAPALELCFHWQHAGAQHASSLALSSAAALSSDPSSESRAPRRTAASASNRLAQLEQQCVSRVRIAASAACRERLIHAIRDNHIHRIVGQRNIFDLPS